MFFKRIDPKTINCIITAKDLQEHGIRMDDLFDRKEEAIDQLKNIIIEHAEAENFSLIGDYTQMRISLLPDHSLSLTLTEGGHVMQTLAEAAKQLKEAVGAQMKNQNTSNSAKVQSHKTVNQDRIREYGYVFSSMEHVIDGCRGIADSDEVESSLYCNEDKTEYYLVLKNLSRNPDADFEKMVLSLSEYGTLLNEGIERLSYIREHETCIVKKNAASTLAHL